MNTLNLQDIKQRGSKALPASGSGPSYVIVNSQPLGVYMPLEEYEMLMDIVEDLEDIQEVEARKNEPTYSWEEVMEDLGVKDEDLQN